jgi:hypothetical protein
MVDAICTAAYGDNIAATIKYRESVVVLQRARPPFLERDV